MARKRKRKGSKKSGQIPLKILSDRYKRLGSILKRRGGLV